VTHSRRVGQLHVGEVYKLFIEKYPTPTDLGSSDMTDIIMWMRTLELRSVGAGGLK